MFDLTKGEAILQKPPSIELENQAFRNLSSTTKSYHETESLICSVSHAHI